MDPLCAGKFLLRLCHCGIFPLQLTKCCVVVSGGAMMQERTCDCSVFGFPMVSEIFRRVADFERYRTL